MSTLQAAKSLPRLSLCYPSVRPLSTDQSLHDAVRQTNSNKDSAVNVQETSDGRGYGLFARRALTPGELVFQGKALKTSSQRTKHSIQVDWNKHVTMDVPAILVNHSCLGNLFVKENDFGAFDFFALRPIPVSSELTLDYELVEYQIGGFDKCECGAPDCRRELKGFEGHSEKVLALYGSDYVAPYLLKNKK